MSELPILEWDDEGHLTVSFGSPMADRWAEAICPECSEPVRWILDKASFVKKGPLMMLCHMACAWTPEDGEQP